MTTPNFYFKSLIPKAETEKLPALPRPQPPKSSILFYYVCPHRPALKGLRTGPRVNCKPEEAHRLLYWLTSKTVEWKKANKGKEVFITRSSRNIQAHKMLKSVQEAVRHASILVCEQFRANIQTVRSTNLRAVAMFIILNILRTFHSKFLSPYKTLND